MQPKSPAWLLLFSTLVSAAVAGCTPPGPVETVEARPFKGKTVRVACPTGGPEKVVQTYSRTWASRTGATVQVIAYDPAGGPKTGACDVLVLRPAALPLRAAAGLLLQLPREFTAPEGSFGWMDLLPVYRERLLLWDRNRYAVPLLGESPLCVYRADLFAEPARREAFQKKFGRDLAPPKTWEEFAEVAEFFRDTTPGGPKPSLPPLPASDEGLDREFFAVAACYARRAMAPGEPERGHEDKDHQLFSFQYDHRTGKPRLATPGFVRALEILKRLQKCRPPGTNANPADTFRDGKAVLALADVGLLTSLQLLPGMADKADVCRMPGGGCYFDYATGKEVPAPRDEPNRVPYLGSGGWLAAVPKTAAEPDAAFALLADLAGRERSAQIVIDPTRGGGLTRRDQVEKTRWAAFGLRPQYTEALKDALQQEVVHPGLQNPAVRLRTPDEAAHEEALLKEVRAFLTADGGDAAKALSAAAARWDEIDREKGVAGARDEYRVSVGLLPLATH